jgi:hypothetical protein
MRPALRPLLLSLLVCIPVTGCQAWRFDPVTPIKNPDSVIHYPGDGGVVISSSSYDFRKVVCVAPPAQSALLRQSKTSAGIDIGVAEVVTIGAQVDHETAEALARIYEQSERSLFLQYSLYRLCEAYMNNMLTPTSGSDILRLEKTQYQAQAERATADFASCTANRASILAASAPNAPTKEHQKALDQLQCGRFQSEKASAEAAAKLIGEHLDKAPIDQSTDQGLLYWLAFQKILDTSVKLAELDAQQGKLRAEAEAALAREAKGKAEKKVEELTKAKTELEALRQQALINALERAKCADGCKDKDKDKSESK